MDDLGSMILGAPPAAAKSAARPLDRPGFKPVDETERKRILADEYKQELAYQPKDEADAHRKEQNLASLRREHGSLPAAPMPRAAAPVATPVAAPEAPQAAASADPLGDMIATPGKVSNMPGRAAQTAQSAMPPGMKVGDAKAPTPLVRSKANPVEILPEVAATTLTGGGAAMLGGASGIGTAVGQMAADVKDVYGGMFKGDFQPLKRFMTGESSRNALEQGGGKASQVQQDQTWKPTTPYAETAVKAVGLPGQALEHVADFAGEKAANVAGPAVGATVKTAIELAPGLLGAKRAPKVGETVPGAAPVVTPPPGIPRYEGKRSGATAEPVPEAAAVAPQSDTLVGVGSARANMNPYPKISGEEMARGGPYPTVKLSKIAADASDSEQAVRAKIANEIVGENGGVRNGVLTGNEDKLRNEYTEARRPTKQGEILKQQIANEQNALSSYAEKRIENTGASPSLIDPYQRGERINSAFAGDEGLTGFFKQSKDRIYKEAFDAVGDNPVQATALEKLLDDPQFKAELKLKGTSDFTGGLGALYEHHKTQGFEGTKPSSIAGLEELRKSLNRQWSPENKYAIGKAVRAIDEDIAKAGGPGLYEQARAVHELEKKLFEPKGIKTLFGDINPLTGTQGATAFENIPKKLNSMTTDEWKHVYDTADMLSKGTINFKGVTLHVPDELRMAAESAKKEMAGSIARDIYEAGANKAGVWNQNAANKVMNAHAKKIEHAFSPEEQQAFHTLNYGGHLMPGVHAYEGAALQGERVKGLAGRLPGLGRAAGDMSRVPFAGAVGEKVGEGAARVISGKKEQKAADILRNQLEMNKYLGKTYDEKMKGIP